VRPGGDQIAPGLALDDDEFMGKGFGCVGEDVGPAHEVEVVRAYVD